MYAAFVARRPVVVVVVVVVQLPVCLLICLFTRSFGRHQVASRRLTRKCRKFKTIPVERPHALRFFCGRAHALLGQTEAPDVPLFIKERCRNCLGPKLALAAAEQAGESRAARRGEQINLCRGATLAEHHKLEQRFHKDTHRRRCRCKYVAFGKQTNKQAATSTPVLRKIPVGCSAER